jgi:hypothetical protein
MVTGSIEPEAVQPEETPGQEQPSEQQFVTADTIQAMLAAQNQNFARQMQGHLDRGLNAIRNDLTQTLAGQDVKRVHEQVLELVDEGGKEKAEALLTSIQSVAPTQQPVESQAVGQPSDDIRQIVQDFGVDPDSLTVDDYAILNNESLDISQRRQQFFGRIKEHLNAPSARVSTQSASQVVNPSVNQSPAASGAGNPDDIRAQFISNKIPKDIYIQKMTALGEEP